jgi:SAM-dependent methyltransferase
VAATRSSSGSRWLVPRRVRGEEYLDAPGVDEEVVTRSLHDVARANRLFGGARAVVAEVRDALPTASPRHATLLDVGTGLGDIPRRVRAMAAEQGVTVITFGIEMSSPLAREAASPALGMARADALCLPFGDASIDIVTCSQVLHHFQGDALRRLLAEMDRVARARVIIAELRRSWIAAAGIWLASYPLGFHPVSRHDGVVSVLRGFRRAELRELIREATGIQPRVVNRALFRVTASWAPRAAAKPRATDAVGRAR